MKTYSGPASVSGPTVLLMVLMNAVFIRNGFTLSVQWYLGLWIGLPILMITVVQHWKLNDRVKQVCRTFPWGGFPVRKSGRSSASVDVGSEDREVGEDDFSVKASDSRVAASESG